MSLDDKSKENLKIAKDFYNSNTYYCAVANRLYYSIFQKVKYFLDGDDNLNKRDVLRKYKETLLGSDMDWDIKLCNRITLLLSQNPGDYKMGKLIFEHGHIWNVLKIHIRNKYTVNNNLFLTIVETIKSDLYYLRRIADYKSRSLNSREIRSIEKYIECVDKLIAIIDSL